MTAGSGPWHESEFDDYLQACKIEPYPLSGDAEEDTPGVIVIGWAEWQQEDLESAIQARAGQTLRVYSQEMVVASLAIGEDVFEAFNETELYEFGATHPALQYLRSRSFDWPSTNVAEASATISFVDMTSPETGLLAEQGYHVGKTGVVAEDRRAILRYLMSLQINPKSARDEQYAKQWGRPGSPERLKKLADCLASLAKLRKRNRTRDYSEAISDWESDLDYLKNVYSHLRTNFDWPSTVVW